MQHYKNTIYFNNYQRFNIYMMRMNIVSVAKHIERNIGIEPEIFIGRWIYRLPARFNWNTSQVTYILKKINYFLYFIFDHDAIKIPHNFRQYITKWSALIGFEDPSISIINFLSSTEKQLKWESEGLSVDESALKNAVLIDQVR